ncbi:MAG: RHS repeat-associated core domain-containing protein, partial [Reinekea sp.]
YINHDPIGLMGGLNAYQYCPNPVGWVDPLGLAPDDLIRYKPVESLTSQAGSRGSAINRAWALERQLVIETGQGTRDWIPKELEIIKATSNSKQLTSRMANEGYTGHHINSVNGNGELGTKWAGDPRNIVFLENANHSNGSTILNEHLSSDQGHRGDYNNSGNGRLIDRQAMLDQFHKSQPKDCS